MDENEDDGWMRMRMSDGWMRISTHSTRYCPDCKLDRSVVVGAGEMLKESAKKWVEKSFSF